MKNQINRVEKKLSGSRRSPLLNGNARNIIQSDEGDSSNIMSEDPTCMHIAFLVKWQQKHIVQNTEVMRCVPKTHNSYTSCIPHDITRKSIIMTTENGEVML